MSVRIEFNIFRVYYYNSIIRFNECFVPLISGAPSAFPTNEKAVKLQEHINLSEKVVKIANNYRLERGFARKPYLAIHLRHGSDWVRISLNFPTILSKNKNLVSK